MAQPLIGDLVGMMKSQSDLVTRPMRIRYTENTTIQSGNTFRLTFPVVADDMLDLRSIRLFFDLAITGDTKTGSYVDGGTVQTIFNRVRVTSGSSTIADITENGLLCSLLSSMDRKTTDNPFTLYLSGRELTPTYEAKRSYVTTIGPRGSILHCDGLLPLSRMSALNIDITLESANKCLVNVNGEVINYSISNVQMRCDYIRSPSISQYFNSNPIGFHVTDYSSRLAVVNSQIAMIRFSTSHSSLTSILSVMRNQSGVSDQKSGGKFTTFYQGSDIENFNCFMNSRMLFDQAVSGPVESFSLLKKAFPQVESSQWYDNNFMNWKHLIAIPLSAAPVSFSKTVKSGVDTTNMNTDALLQINFKAQPAVPYRVDSFLISDVTITLENGRGDLKLRY